jgi:hypothetical protein
VHGWDELEQHLPQPLLVVGQAFLTIDVGHCCPYVDCDGGCDVCGGGGDTSDLTRADAQKLMLGPVFAASFAL